MVEQEQSLEDAVMLLPGAVKAGGGSYIEEHRSCWMVLCLLQEMVVITHKIGRCYSLAEQCRIVGRCCYIVASREIAQKRCTRLI